MDDLFWCSASTLVARIRDGELSSRELVQALVGRIEGDGARFNAVVTLDAERALESARKADEALARGGPVGPLHGLPFTLKDTFCTAGLRTTAGAPDFASYVPAEDSAVAARLRSAGGVLLGKTNTPPFASQSQTDNPIFGRTVNPWDPSRTPGGSSGGSAAAVCAGLSPLDIGSDATGSLRMPAHFTGVYTLKPTARRVSTVGHIPEPPGVPRLDRHLGCAGPLARSIDDLALALQVLAGPDPRDSEVPPVPFRRVQRIDPARLRVAFAPTLPGVVVRKEIADKVVRVASLLDGAGVPVEEGLPAADLGAHREAWLAFVQILRQVFADATGAKLGTLPSTAQATRPMDWVRALDGRDRAIRDWEALFADWDVFLCPTAPVTAFPHCPPGTPLDVDGSQVESWRIDHFVYPFSFTGNPAVVLPAGIDRDGLPIGVQLVGARWADEELIEAARVVDGIVSGYRPPPEGARA